MGEKVRERGFAGFGRPGDDLSKLPGAPVDDSGGEDVQARDPAVMYLGAAATDFPRRLRLMVGQTRPYSRILPSPANEPKERHPPEPRPIAAGTGPGVSLALSGGRRELGWLTFSNVPVIDLEPRASRPGSGCPVRSLGGRIGTKRCLREHDVAGAFTQRPNGLPEQSFLTAAEPITPEFCTMLRR